MLNKSYIWTNPEWPAMTWDAARVQTVLTQVRLTQGRMTGLAQGLELVRQGALALHGLEAEAVATAKIEGETLAIHSVRASAARRLGLDPTHKIKKDERTEATLDVLEMTLKNWQLDLTHEDLFAWQAALFPTGRSGGQRIVVGGYRTHPDPMQIVTPQLGKNDVVHYEAPASRDVYALMDNFLAWFNHSKTSVDGVVRAALAHLWFETIHPFEDGNGRVGRALIERTLAQDLQNPMRLWSISHQLWTDRVGYYRELNAASASSQLDVTDWVLWFARCVGAAANASIDHVQGAVAKTKFWAELRSLHPELTSTQAKAINRLYDAKNEGGAEGGGFIGGMSTEKYGRLCGVSRATAYRELADLVAREVFSITGQGRGTRYWLIGERDLSLKRGVHII